MTDDVKPDPVAEAVKVLQEAQQAQDAAFQKELEEVLRKYNRRPAIQQTVVFVPAQA